MPFAHVSHVAYVATVHLYMRITPTQLKALAFMHKKPFLHKDISELFSAPCPDFPGLGAKDLKPQNIMLVDQAAGSNMLLLL